MSLYDFTAWVNKLEEQLNPKEWKIAEEIVKELKQGQIPVRCGLRLFKP